VSRSYAVGSSSDAAFRCQLGATCSDKLTVPADLPRSGSKQCYEAMDKISIWHTAYTPALAS